MRSAARRNGRKHSVRNRTESMARFPLLLLRSLAYDNPYPDDIERPLTRGDCVDGVRPCPWVSCRHHLYLDVLPKTGALKHNFPDLEVSEMAESCSLDHADARAELERVGELMNLTHEAVRQIQETALRKLVRLPMYTGLK